MKGTYFSKLLEFNAGIASSSITVSKSFSIIHQIDNSIVAAFVEVRVEIWNLN